MSTPGTRSIDPGSSIAEPVDGVGVIVVVQFLPLVLVAVVCSSVGLCRVVEVPPGTRHRGFAYASSVEPAVVEGPGGTEVAQVVVKAPAVPADVR